MGGPSPEQGRGNRHQLQTDTTQNSRKTIMDQSLPGISFAANRTVVNFFRTMPIDLHVYNGGTVASVATIAFVGAKYRYASVHSTFMIHRTHSIPQGPQTATKLRALIALLQTDDPRTEAILRAHTNIPPERWALLDSQDVLFNASEAVQFGLADVIREFEVPPGNQIFNV
jgi:ATP-dependent protease ClpP protease subunit